MLMPIISGMVVSIDAFFIGLSLGMQKRCRFLHLAGINAFLGILCFLGYFLAGRIYHLIPFDPDLVVGYSFIALGLWTIFCYFISKKGDGGVQNIAITGLIISLEAMMVTMGITIIFAPAANIAIPITVALAHFVYCIITFYLTKTKRIRQISASLSHIISGLALIIYGIMALFIELDNFLI